MIFIKHSISIIFDTHFPIFLPDVTIGVLIFSYSNLDLLIYKIKKSYFGNYLK